MDGLIQEKHDGALGKNIEKDALAELETTLIKAGENRSHMALRRRSIYADTNE